MLSFNDNVKLSQIQILSHEYCISRRIEIFVADHQPDGGSRSVLVDKVAFKKLGHLTLDTNEKSNYGSRELKSVFLDSPLRLVKLVCHTPHPNIHNTFSQVGIISIKCLGKLVNGLSTVEQREVTEDATPMFQSLKNFLGTSEAESVPNTALPAPEPLPDYFERDYPHLVSSLSLSIAAHLCSRDWRLREKGVTMLLDRTRASGSIQEALIPGLVWTVKRLITDKIVNVYIRITELIQTVVSLRPPKSPIPDLNDALDLVIMHMMDNRLCDFNKRIADSTCATLVSIAKDADKRVLPASTLVVQYVLKPYDGSPRTVAGRCTLLSALIHSIGLVKSKGGVALEQLLPLIASWLNKGGDIRVSALHVLNATLSCIDFPKFESIVTTLAIPQAMKDVLLHEAVRVGPDQARRPIDRISECEFCGKTDPAFADEANMDMHYWDECPLLIECRFCEQIVEITGLTEHRLKECENGEAADNHHF